MGMHSFIGIFAGIPERLQKIDELKGMKMKCDINVPTTAIDRWHYHMELPDLITKEVDDVLCAFLDFQITTLKNSESLSREEVIDIIKGMLKKITRKTHKAREMLRQEMEDIIRGKGEWDFRDEDADEESEEESDQ